MFVIAAPGQGSQKPGFLEPWLHNEHAREQLASWSLAIDIDLIAHGTTSDAETITDTSIAQPLIVAAGILTGQALLAQLPEDTDIRFAGHSVGEFTAAALAGVLEPDDALRLVAIRGRAMAHAAQATPTGMSAVIGGEPDDLEAALTLHHLSAANHNGGGQTVIAGALENLEKFQQNPPAGSRVIPLRVAGAFHTHFMTSAVQALSDAARTVATKDPRHPLYTNRDGTVVTDGTTTMSYLIDQVARPVRWDYCMASFAKDDIHGMMELSPAGALTGLAKRALKGVPTVAINQPDDLLVATDMVAAL